MKKFLTLVLVIGLLAAFAACANGDDDTNTATVLPVIDGVTHIRIGATPRPHMEILEYIAPYLLADGIALELIEFTPSTPRKAGT